MSRDPGPYEGSGPATGRRQVPRAKIVLRVAVILLLLSFFVGVTAGGDVGRLTVVNMTPHYIHVIVDGDPFLYVSPGAGAIFEKEGYSTVVAKAFYSPGQGVEGSAERTFSIAPYEPSSMGCSWSTLECTTSPSSGGARSWEVSADTLVTAQESGVVPR